MITRGPGGRVLWAPQHFMRRLDREMSRRMMMVLVYLARRTKENINVPTNVYGPSAPGEYLHKVRGDLQRSIFRRGPRKRGRRVEGDIGTNLIYGLHWELTNRPFLRRTMIEEQTNWTDILTR